MVREGNVEKSSVCDSFMTSSPLCMCPCEFVYSVAKKALENDVRDAATVDRRTVQPP